MSLQSAGELPSVTTKYYRHVKHVTSVTTVLLVYITDLIRARPVCDVKDNRSMCVTISRAQVVSAPERNTKTKASSTLAAGNGVASVNEV